MRVLLVAPVPPLVDGLATYSDALAKIYAAEDHQVATVATQPPPTGEQAWWLSLSPLRWLRTTARILRWSPDVVHVQHTIATYGLRLLALWPLVLLLRLTGTSVLITHHEVTRDTRRLGPPGLAYYALTTRLADLAHVHTSEAERTVVSQLGMAPDRVVLSPHPVFRAPDLGATVADLRAAHHLGDRRIVLQFGFVHPEKGIADTVKAFAELLRRRPELRATTQLVIAGAVRDRPPGFGRFEAADRDYLDQVLDDVARLGIADRVTFTGSVPETDVRGWFEAAALVVLPYRNAEQSGVANLAIAVGTPVLSTGAGGLAELLAGLPRITGLNPADYAADLAAALDDLDGLRTTARRVYAGLRAAGDPVALIERADQLRTARRRGPDRRQTSAAIG